MTENDLNLLGRDASKALDQDTALRVVANITVPMLIEECKRLRSFIRDHAWVEDGCGEPRCIGCLTRKLDVETGLNPHSDDCHYRRVMSEDAPL